MASQRRPGANSRDFFGVGLMAKLNRIRTIEDEDDGGGEQFAGTEFRAQFLAEQDGGVGEEAHGGGSGASEGEDGTERRAGFGVGDDGAGIEVDGAGGERGDFRFAVKAHDDGAAGAIDVRASELASQVMPRGSRPVAGSSKSRTEGRWIRARAMAMRWRMPREKVRTREARRSIEADFAEKFFGAGGGLSDILEFSEEEEIFFGGRVRRRPWWSGRRSRGGHCRRLRSGAGKGELACGGPNDLRGDAQEGGFAGAVAACKDDAFAGSNFEGDAAEGEKSAIAFIDVVEAQAGWR